MARGQNFRDGLALKYDGLGDLAEFEYAGRHGQKLAGQVIWLPPEAGNEPVPTVQVDGGVYTAGDLRGLSKALSQIADEMDRDKEAVYGNYGKSRKAA